MQLTFDDIARYAVAEVRKRKHAIHTDFTLALQAGHEPISCLSLYRYSQETGICLTTIFWQIDLWWSDYENGRWCTRCHKRPKAKYNHRLCSQCARVNVSAFEPSGGGYGSGGKSRVSFSGHVQSRKAKP